MQTTESDTARPSSPASPEQAPPSIAASPAPRPLPAAGPQRLRRMIPVRHRVLNSRLLLRSGFGAVAILIAGNVWHAYMVYRNAASLVRRAERQEQAGDWAAAAESLRRYLALRSDAAARVRLAEDFDRAATTADGKYTALALFASAVAAQPHELAPRRRHLQLTYELGDYTSALERAEQLLQIEPADAFGQKYLALALYARWELREVSLEKVQKAFEAARKANPADEAIAARLARLYRAEPERVTAGRKPEVADAVLDDLVETSGEKVAALLARYNYRCEFALPGADADLDLALQLIEGAARPAAAAEGDLFLAAGRREQVRGHEAQAAAYYRRAVDAAPDRWLAYLLQSQAQRRAGDATAAMRTLEQGLGHAGPNSRRLQSPLASLEIELGRLAEAEKLLSVMQSEAALLFGQEQVEWLSTISALRAELLLARGDHLGAIEHYKRALLLRVGGAAYGEKAATDARLQGRLALCYSTFGQWDLAAMAYQAAADLVPQRPALRLAAAEAWDKLGSLKEAVRQYEEALSRDHAPPEAWLKLADARYRRQMILPASKRDWKPLRETLAGAENALPGSAALKLLRAEYELANERPELAAAALETIDPQALAEPRLQARLAEAYERLGRPVEADRIAARAEEASPRHGVPLKCELLLRRDPQAPVEDVLQDAMDRWPADQGVLRYHLALVHLGRGRREEACRQLNLAADASAGDLRPVQLLAELALASGDLGEVARQAERLMTLEKVEGASGFQYYEAQRLMREAQRLSADEREQKLSQARTLESQLMRFRPYWTRTYLLKAQIAQLDSRPDDEAAILAYYEALRLGERRIEVYQELLALLLRHERLSEAALLIDEFREGDDVPPSLTAMAVTADVAQGNVERAVRVAAADVRRNPDSVAGRLRLSQLLVLHLPADAAAREKRLDQAVAELLEARKLAPRDPRVWSALLTFYHAAGRLELARGTLAEIEADDFLSEADRPFFLAQAYALLGDDAQAKQLYVAAVEAAPERLAPLSQAGDFLFGRDPARAEQYFRRALKIQPEQPAAARKLAALVALRSTSDQEMEEAWRILDGDDRPGPRSTPDPADERLRAVLLLRRGGLAARQQAQRLLESFVAEGSQQPLDYLLLARLYESQGATAKARQLLETLVRQDHPDADHLAAYLDHALRTADQETVADRRLGDTLDRLSRIEPESRHFRTLNLRGRWLRLTERAREIPALVEQFLAASLPPADTAERTGRLLRVADLYESLGFSSRAESCYRQANEISPHTCGPLAVWLARHERPADAIALCRQAAKADASAAPATALATALAAGWTTIGERSAAEELFADALARHPDDGGLLFSLAMLRLKLHEDKQGEELLRRYLRLEPRSAVAMNNLAILLADRHDAADEALELTERAIALAGARPELVDTKGWVLFEQQRYEEAADSFREALALSPAKAVYRFHLAMTCARQGKQDDSLDLDRAFFERLSKQTLRPKEREELRKLVQRMK